MQKDGQGKLVSEKEVVDTGILNLRAEVRSIVEYELPLRDS